MSSLFLLVFGGLWLLAVLASRFYPDLWDRKHAGWVLPLAGIALMLFAGKGITPLQRLMLGALELLYLLKATVWMQKPLAEIRQYSKAGFLLYMTVWPGMEPEAFRQRKPFNESDEAVRFLRGYLFVCAGFV